MSQVMAFPAASQELDQVALSPSKVTKSLSPERLLSNSLAVTVIVVLSLKRLAVSLTTANASGNILFNVSSVAV